MARAVLLTAPPRSDRADCRRSRRLPLVAAV